MKFHHWRMLGGFCRKLTLMPTGQKDEEQRDKDRGDESRCQHTAINAGTHGTAGSGAGTRGGRQGGGVRWN